METSNANPFCWATAERLSTVSATTDSCGAGEAVASKVGAGETEREGKGDGFEQKCTRAETGDDHCDVGRSPKNEKQRWESPQPPKLRGW